MVSSKQGLESVRAGSPMVDALEGRVLMSAAPTANVYKPGATVKGDSLSEYVVAWHKWALGARADQSPQLDTTGEFGGLNQPKNVFFLTGALGEGNVTVSRTVKVPTGTPLFFPVLNSFWVNVDQAIPEVYPVADPPFEPNEAAIRADFANHIANYQDLFATVDGKPVSNLASHVEQDPAGGFNVNFPQNNLFGLPPEILGKNADAGIFVMLKPLSPGKHVIHFGGTDPLLNPDFSLDVTYNINVVPKGQLTTGQPARPGSKPSPFNAAQTIAAKVLLHSKDPLEDVISSR